MINFENTFHNLKNDFYENVVPSIPPNPELITYNKNLAKSLNVDLKWLESTEGLKCFTGSKVMKNSNPLSMVYAGHQFGNWVPRLGDGRAILLGELIDNNNERWDIQLKGSGLTPFSRNGDGKAVLGPILREYLISHAMNCLGVPTTLALTIAKTGENIRREKNLPGAIITRVAKSHIRVGTFQYFASQGKYELIKDLSDYVINRHFPEIDGNKNKYFDLFRCVLRKQAKLISKWMSIGFIHGVMNTDNCSIIGDTIDYGPCAFMDNYKKDTVFSSIDTFGRYAFKNQPIICQWNLVQLANCLLPLFSNNKEKNIQMAQNEIDKFYQLYENFWSEELNNKLGFRIKDKNDTSLVKELFEIMENDNLDFTITFSSLSLIFKNKKNSLLNYNNNSEGFKKWVLKWKSRLTKEKQSKIDIEESLRNNNPFIIPRNHLVEEAIKDANYNNFEKFHKLFDLVSNPFKFDEGNHKYHTPPEFINNNYKTFCGT